MRWLNGKIKKRDDKMLNIGDRVFILSVKVIKSESSRYCEFKVIKIYNKNLYKMYLCENLKTKTKETIVDADLYTVGKRKLPTAIKK